jgi:hypothetical protein
MRFNWLFLTCAMSLVTGCSSAPPAPITTAAEREAAKYPTPPTIFSHTMRAAHTVKMDRVRYSPSAIFQLKNCEGCFFVYDETSVSETGENYLSVGVSDGDIINKFGSFQGGSLTSETGWAAMNIVKFCYHNLRLCKSEDPSSCTALNPKLAYELNLETGRVNTNLPVTDPDLRQPASETKKFRSICPSLRRSKAAKAK